MPHHLIVVGIIAHLLYLYMLRGFPYIRTTSPPFIFSGIACATSQVLWFVFLRSTWYPFEEVCAYFVILVWLVPFIYFISISSNDTALPYGATISASTSLSTANCNKILICRFVDLDLFICPSISRILDSKAPF